MSDFEVSPNSAFNKRLIREEHATMVAKLTKPGENILATLTPEKVDLWHVATGAAGEAGELLDAVKKYVAYNKPFDRENVIEELGDLEFYLAAIRANVGVSREETLAHNIRKLSKGKNARYADGYSDAAAQARADKQATGETEKMVHPLTVGESSMPKLAFTVGDAVTIKSPDEWPILNGMPRPVRGTISHVAAAFSVPYTVHIPFVGDVCYREQDLEAGHAAAIHDYRHNGIA